MSAYEDVCNKLDIDNFIVPSIMIDIGHLYSTILKMGVTLSKSDSRQRIYTTVTPDPAISSDISMSESF